MALEIDKILDRYNITKLGTTLLIDSKDFSFSYTPANDVVKDEYRDQYRYFGGLQSNFPNDSEDHKNLEGVLCDLAERVLGIEWKRK